ncbi:MAG: hypothetical protein JJE51_02440 [Thermoanaerobaculia bacterium]|nr:hypothetical protein [Thermoanaerobaculia bacterium]
MSLPAVAPSAPENLYALVADGFVKSVNGGMTWIAGGTVGSTYYGYYGTSLTVDPVVPSTLYIASDGIFKSSDGGTTWSDLPTDRSLTADIRSIVIDPSNTSVLYAGVASHYYRPERGILKSVDAGVSWTVVGLPSESVMSMLIDPVKPTTVYAGTQRGEIFRSVDSGGEWSQFGEPLDAAVLALAVDRSGRHIRAATPSGVYAYDIGDPRLPIERLPADPTRLSRLLDQIGARHAVKRGVLSVGENGAGSAFIIGAAGSVQGGGGTYFRSDVSLVNWRETAQKLIVVWIAQGMDGTNAPAFQVTLPGQSSATSADTITSRDFVTQLGITGLGSLLFIAADSSGNLDPSAAVDGFSRTWTPRPGQSGTESQSTVGTGLGQMRGQLRAAALGLRQDGSFRTNVGLVNLDAQSHRFTIRAQGENRTEEKTVEVMPFSMVQVPLPVGNYGSLALTVATEVTLPTFAWTFYGSSVDNVTGDSWMSTPSTIGPTP